MRRRWQKLTSDWLPRAIVRFGIALVLTAATGVVLKVLAKAGSPLVILACLGVFFVALGLMMRGASAPPPSGTARPVPEARAPDAPVDSVAPQTEATEDSRQPIFDEAPPDLADMTQASLKDFFASRTNAQASELLLEQHRGEQVRVSGEVEDVELTGTPRIHSRSAGVALTLFFDADAKSSLLSLHNGDKIVVSGQIYDFAALMVFLDKCKLNTPVGGS